MAKVYVSSTYQDLQEHRDKVRAVLRRISKQAAKPGDKRAMLTRRLQRGVMWKGI